MIKIYIIMIKIYVVFIKWNYQKCFVKKRINYPEDIERFNFAFVSETFW